MRRPAVCLLAIGQPSPQQHGQQEQNLIRINDIIGFRATLQVSGYRACEVSAT